MSYLVDYAALASLKSSLTVQSSNWNSHLKRLQTRADRIAQSKKISGQAADNIKLYMGSMYGTLIDLFAKLITLHVDNYLLYQRDYHCTVDPQTDALIEEKELEAVKKEVEAKKAGVAAIDGAIEYALLDVRDIFPFSNSGDELSKVNEAHDNLITAIEKIDTNIKQIESTHSSNDFVNSSQLISVLKQFLAEAAGQGRDFKRGFSPDKLAGLSTYSALLDAKLAVENELDQKAEEKASTAQKDELIRAYEEKHPDVAQELDTLLEKVTEESIREIKYFIYTVGEPYASIYLNTLGKYSLGNLTGNAGGTSYYSPKYNTVNDNFFMEPSNPRGPYTTFFHESGHAIDNILGGERNYSESYRNEADQTLMDVIYLDVKNDVTAAVKDNTFLDETDQQALVNYIMGAGSVDISTLSPEAQSALGDIQKYYYHHLYGAVNEAPSDVYGGITNNIIVGQYGHSSENYWYGTNGKPTGAQCRELWAEYYSYCMTGNTVAMERIRTQFPQASQFLDEMAASMANEG